MIGLARLGGSSYSYQPYYIYNVEISKCPQHIPSLLLTYLCLTNVQCYFCHFIM